MPARAYDHGFCRNCNAVHPLTADSLCALCFTPWTPTAGIAPTAEWNCPHCGRYHQASEAEPAVQCKTCETLCFADIEPTEVKLSQLAALVEKLARIPFTCTMAAQAAQKILGGQVLGYFVGDNPTAKLGQDEGGHDFLLVDGVILDLWALAYYGKRPLLHLRRDAEEIRALYGDPAAWKPYGENQWRPAVQFEPEK